MPGLSLLAILAHPDDETLGLGGTFARYAREGVATHVLTATRGQSGRFGDARPGDDAHPGRERLGVIREAEERAAARVLGISDVSFLDCMDGALDQADARAIVPRIAAHIRRVRPQVIVTFAPDGAYGHPDHIAISQFAGAAAVAAADPSFAEGTPHAVSKFYYFAWPEAAWALYQKVFKKLVSKVDGVERQANPWPEWALTTSFDAGEHWRQVWKAVQCHESQMSVFANLKTLSEDEHRRLWGRQYFYRTYSAVNGGRRESDLFEGLRA